MTRRVAVVVLLALATPAFAWDGSGEQATDAHGSPNHATPGRLAPPSGIRCDRNRLTSVSGAVSGYRRGAGETHIEITTDRGSVETFTLPHPTGRVEERFLFWGWPFGTDDWGRIETAPGRLTEGLKAVVWVCEDPSVTPVVDWRPLAASSATSDQHQPHTER